MRARLNGWQRLWIVISILYLLPVAGIVVISWPTPETTWHRDEFIAQMPAELRGHVDEALPPGVTPITPSGKNVIRVSFPNGAVLQIHVAKEGDKEPDARVGGAYWAVVQSATRAARWTMVWHSALVWFIPCLMVYVLGWATAWVRQGFTVGRDRTTR